MPDRVAPNPYSPYATADPATRHLFMVPIFVESVPAPGTLHVTGCAELAVVTADVIEVFRGDDIPQGVCPLCVTAMTGGGIRQTPAGPTQVCRECGLATKHGDQCTLCRAEAHDTWWAEQTREADHG